jgi:phosphoribosylanthranilate isomerase
MKLKICGMKYKDNIIEVAKLQLDYLGFIFYEKSARFFDGEIPQLPNTIKKVGVFVNASIETILEKTTNYKLQVIQLHGNESPKFCKSLNSYGVKIIKVFSIKDKFNFDELKPYENVCDYYLFDTKGKLPGGNGYTFNWNVLKNYPSTKPYFLSGGIGLTEIENIKLFQKTEASKYCYAIDVNSKFEIEAGLKNIDELKEFKSHINNSFPF